MKISFIIGRYSTWLHGPIDVEKLYHDRAITGSESSFFNAARGLAELGHDVTIYGDFTDMERSKDPKPSSVGGAHLRHVDQDLDVDQDAYVSLNEPEQFKRLPDNVRGLRVVQHQYNDFAHCNPDFADRVDVFACLSPVHKRHILEISGIPEEKTCWIPNSIASDLFTKAPYVVRNHHVAAWTSSPDRGLHRLLEIWPEVRTQTPDAELHVFYRFDPWYQQFKDDQGKAGARARYINVCFSTLGRNGENGVYLEGPRSNFELVNFLKGTGVLPYTCEPMSFTEGFSVSVMDACAAGVLPIISTIDAIGDIYDGIVPQITAEGEWKERRRHWISSIHRAMNDGLEHARVTGQALKWSDAFGYKNVALLWERLLSQNFGLPKDVPPSFNELPSTIMKFAEDSRVTTLKQAATQAHIEAPTEVTSPASSIANASNSTSYKISHISNKHRIAVMMGKLSASIHGRYDIDKIYDEGLLTGTGSNFFNIGWGLAERGHQVDMFVETTKPSFISHPKVGGANVYNIDQSSPDGTYDAYISINEPDVLRVAPSNKLRICAMWLNDFGYCVPSFDSFVDYYACASNTQARYLAATNPIDVSKFLVIPLSFNPEFFSQPVTRDLRSLVYCSSPDRGLHHVVSSWPQIRARVADATLKIFYRFQPWYDSVIGYKGDGHVGAESAFRAKIIGDGIDASGGRDGQGGITIVGPVSSKRMAKELLSASALVYPCDPIRFTEGFSVSILDACAAGCVPIVAGVDALPEVYSGSVYMIPGTPCLNDESRDQWVDAITKVLTDESFAMPLRAAAKAHSTSYTRGKIAAVWETLISERKK
jgi:glycosyltransferase involved in cell wall biosynthesis